MKISNKRSNKMTNEKPVKISLDFKEAVAALLKIKPKPIYWKSQLTMYSVDHLNVTVYI